METAIILLVVFLAAMMVNGLFGRDRVYKNLNTLMVGRKCRTNDKEYLIKYIGFFVGVSAKEIRNGVVSTTTTRFKLEEIEVVYEVDDQWRKKAIKMLSNAYTKKAVKSFIFLQ